MAEWYGKINFAEKDDTIGDKTAEVRLKIVRRLTPTAINHLDALEFVYNKQHPLAKWTALDAVMGKTSCPKNVTLQERLLEFVVAGAHVRCLRGTYDKKPDFRTRAVPLLLALRRIVHYISWKLQCKNIAETFGEWTRFHVLFPRGKLLEAFEPEEVLTFPELFPAPSERCAAEGLQMLFDGTGDHIIHKCLAKDVNMSAEGILSMSELCTED